MNKNFLYASAILIGTIVGAGMFGLPYVVARSGFLIGAIFLLVLTGVTLLIHLIYGEIVCRTTEKHRLVGYAEHYLGKWGKRIATFSILIGLYGSLLVYIIISGEFLSTIFSPFLGGSPFIYSLVFLVIGAFAVFKDLALVKKMELGMSLLLISIVVLIFFSGLPHLDISNFKNIDLKYFFLPYGVIFWALAGGAAIPEIREILEADGKKYKKTIILGTIIPAILYFLFMLTVVGISGQATSPEAIKGLTGFLGEGIIILGAVLGFLAVITSYFVIGLYLKKVFWYDLADYGLYLSKYEKEKLYAEQYYELRFLPKDLSSPLVIFIFGNKVTQILWGKQSFAFVLESKEIKESFMKYFKYFWERAKKE